MQNKSEKSFEVLLQDLNEAIKKNGLKSTKQRELLLKTLYDNKQHLTPEELHLLLSKKYPKSKIGIATVYRTLSLLEKSHLVSVLAYGSGGKRYELTTKSHHDHLICTECNKIVEFYDERVEKLQEEIAQKNGFLIKEHVMQIYGLCEECLKKDNK